MSLTRSSPARPSASESPTARRCRPPTSTRAPTRRTPLRRLPKCWQTKSPSRPISVVAEVEDVRLLGPLHALLEVFLPQMGPRAAEHVGHFVLELGARRQRRRMAVDGKDRRDAFDERRRIAFLEAGETRVVAHDAD